MDIYRDLIFEHARRTADVLVAMFGTNCEVAVHDFRDINHSLVYLAGSLTNRSVGAPITDLVLNVINCSESEVTDIVNYRTTTKTGEEMKSSTVFLRGMNGKLIGALCINFRVTELRMLTHAIEDLISFNVPEKEEKKESFPSNVQEMVEEIVAQIILRIGKDPEYLTIEEKTYYVSLLENKGLFLIKGAIDYVAGIFGISKYTLYSYLAKVRSEQVFQNNTGGGQNED